MEDESKLKRTKEGSGDGLANVLSKILAETTGTKKSTVLAKRKTESMRDLEKAAESREVDKRLKLLKKEELHKQQKLPNEYEVDKEKMLKRVATQGVVALFNAIANAKRVTKPLSKTKEKLARRKQGQINKLKGLDTGTKSTPNNAGSTAAESSSAASSNWAVLTDDVNATQKIATSLYYNNPSNSSIGGKSGVVKTKSDKVNKRKHWDEDGDA